MIHCVRRFSKRVMDILVSVVGLALLAIPFAISCLLIRLESRGPAFFRQLRIGRGAKPFRVWKLRTMVADAETQGAGHGFEKDDPRITRVGRFLRRAGVDELPQLFNVLRGEMSLVGPRPALPHQVDLYTDIQRRRLSVKPGVTGLALIRGRNELPWSKRIEYDLEYVDYATLSLDVAILIKTIWVVLLGQGLRMDQLADEVEDFKGTGS